MRLSILIIFKKLMPTRTFLLILTSLTNVFSQNYLWPTNASKALTSSFCEYRPAHYHAAIDIKTWNKEGYPIYAIEDGRIYRIWVSPFGYGKVLYLRLNDGRVAVYAHLQKFNENLENRVFREQIKKERYTVQFYPDDIIVKRGDILGYTGKTGIGTPHLHFEIRDTKDRPLNPLYFYEKLEDNIPPHIQSLLVIPYGKSSRVDGSYLPKTYFPIRKKNGEYTIEEPVIVKGSAGLAFECYDMADGVTNKYVHHQVKLYLNGRKYFHMSYDTLDYDKTGQIDVDIYYPQKVRFNDVYNKLFVEPFNTLDFYDRSLGNGIIDVKGEIPFRLEVNDFNGNTSTVNGKMVEDYHVEMQMSLLKKINSSVILDVLFPEPLSELSFYKKDKAGQWIEVNYFEFLKPPDIQGSYNTLIRIKIGDEAADSLRCRIKTINGRAGGQSLALNAGSKPRFNPSFYNQGNALLFMMEGISYQPGMQLRLKSSSIEKYVKPEFRNNKFEQVIGADLFSDQALQISVMGRNDVFYDTTLYLAPFYPDTMMNYSFNNTSISFQSAPTTFYDTMLISFDDSEIDTTLRGGFAMSHIIKLESNPQSFREKARLTIKTDAALVAARQVGMYEWDRKEGWEYLGGEWNQETLKVSSLIREIGKYLVIADTMPPILEWKSPVINDSLSYLREIRFKAVDELSGIQSDANISIRIDGKFVIPEWDPEEHWIRGNIHWQLMPGAHQILIEIKDVCGNKAYEIRDIYIK